MVGVSATGLASAESKTEAPALVKLESGNPMSGDADAIKAGRKLYVRWCQQCHGVKLDGYSPRWGKHGADLRKFWQGFRQFALIVLEGVPEKRMPAHKEYLSGEQVLQIGAYIETKSMKGANWK
ncbi:MAG: cytochrome c [Burkholderiaceae bacterium]